jgi:hypothetical protein
MCCCELVEQIEPRDVNHDGTYDYIAPDGVVPVFGRMQPR